MQDSCSVPPKAAAIAADSVSANPVRPAGLIGAAPGSPPSGCQVVQPIALGAFAQRFWSRVAQAGPVLQATTLPQQTQPEDTLMVEGLLAFVPAAWVPLPRPAGGLLTCSALAPKPSSPMGLVPPRCSVHCRYTWPPGCPLPALSRAGGQPSSPQSADSVPPTIGVAVGSGRASEEQMPFTPRSGIYNI